MTDTEEMVRLMEHAASLLARGMEPCRQRASMPLVDAADRDAMVGAVSGMAYAKAVLQMVAASVAPESRRLAARLQAEYAAWADANDYIGMSDGELAAVARFLTSTGGES